MTESSPAESASWSALPSADRIHHVAEVVATVILALATVMTAWAAFQATKWGGVQANSYAMAGAARVESARASSEAGQLMVIDVSTFTSWVAALSAEMREGEPTGLEGDGTYVPQPGTESGFLFERLRGEFRPAVDAWLDTRPLMDPDAPKTPFEMPEYQLSASQRSLDLVQEAEDHTVDARAANLNGDNYVLMTILSAVALFFAGISSKLVNPRVRVALVAVAAVVFTVAAVVIATFPKQF